jgi:phosphoserine phosphatase
MEKQTSRLEAFSDGIFAVAITLLAIEIGINEYAGANNTNLWHKIIERWPEYFSYFNSFATVLLIWMGHNKIFKQLSAEKLGYKKEMDEFEKLSSIKDITYAREQMLKWYNSTSPKNLKTYLNELQFAPGIFDGIQKLKQHNVKVAIASVTWEFAVEWVARKIDADYFIGTKIINGDTIEHLWPSDKSKFVNYLSNKMKIDLSQVAVIGDSSGDIPMLKIVQQAIYLGEVRPENIPNLIHWENDNILEIANYLLKKNSTFYNIGLA